MKVAISAPNEMINAPIPTLSTPLSRNSRRSEERHAMSRILGSSGLGGVAAESQLSAVWSCTVIVQQQKKGAFV